MLSLPLLFITMGGRRLFQSRVLLQHLNWIEFALATPIVLWGGAPFFEKFFQSLKHRSLNMFTLIGLGVAVAYVYSLIALFFPALFPPTAALS